MPRYHFDVINGHGLERDAEGKDMEKQDIPGHVASILADIAREELPATPEAVIRVAVRDDRERAVFRGELAFKAEWSE